MPLSMIRRSPPSALAHLAAKKLEELARIDPALGEIRESLKPAEIALSEASYALRDYLGGLEANPGAAGRDRIPARGHRQSQTQVWRDHRRDARLSRAGYAQYRRRGARGRAHGRASGRAPETGVPSTMRSPTRLSARRRETARKLAKRVETELAGLAMERSVFEIAVRPSDASASGNEAIEFLVSPNLGEAPKPIEKIASGGEISRIALALKSCVTAPGRGGGTVRTLVFDEVDAGIGGSVAEGVGRRLKKLSANSQVLCVTHLAQIACFADHHYLIEKHEQKGRTVVTVEELDADARTREIGRMLSGQKVTPEALKHAERLLALSAK